MILLEIDFGTPAYDDALRLRDEILRKPLGMSFDIEDIVKEIDQHHLGLYDNQMNLLACLSLILEENIAKMRQVAVQDTLQGKGIGTALVLASEEWLRELNYIKVYCHARKAAFPFYKKLSYQEVGKEFEEVGIPHYKMEKNLTR